MRLFQLILPLLVLTGCASEIQQRQMSSYQQNHARQKKMVNQCMDLPAFKSKYSDSSLRKEACENEFSVTGNSALRCTHFSIDSYAMVGVMIDEFDILEVTAACAVHEKPSLTQLHRLAFFFDLPKKEQDAWPIWDGNKVAGSKHRGDYSAILNKR